MITDALTLTAARTCMFQKKEVYYKIYIQLVYSPFEQVNRIMLVRNVLQRKLLIPCGSSALPHI